MQADPSKPAGPTASEVLPSWRTALVAYREVRRTGQLDEPAFRAALAAFRELRPELSKRDAIDELTRAISWASVEHSAWLWNGVRSPWSPGGARA